MEFKDLGKNDLPGVFNLLKQTWYSDNFNIDSEINDAQVMLDLDHIFSKSSWSKVVMDAGEVKAVITVRVNAAPNNLGMFDNH